jgi:two-component system chemotaxis response regulator CheB
MTTRSSNYKLNDEERDFVFALIERVTGTCQEGTYRREVLASNVERRIRYVGAPSLRAYLTYATTDASEGELLLSALTIHTTSWFREAPHFHKFEAMIRQRLVEHKINSIRVLCAACSTGEEAYSIAFTLEHIRRSAPGFEYHVHGVDIDPLSVEHASRGMYGEVALPIIPGPYREFCLVGTGQRRGFFTPNRDVRSRCSFGVADLRTFGRENRDSFDCIFCRNVLIYFKSDDVSALVKGLLTSLRVDGALFLGHSEAIDATRYGIRFLGDSTYLKRASFLDATSVVEDGCRVLVVDDSLAARKALERALERGGIQAFSVASADEATEFLERNSVDVITLDVTMPGLDGPTWLNSRRIAGLDIPVVIVSESGPAQATAILGALENGAQDYIEKSTINGPEFAEKLIAISQSYKPGHSTPSAAAFSKPTVSRERPDLILVGASTGGTEAVMRLLETMPPNSPPIVVVQHISSYFARAFAQRVAHNANLRLGVCAEGTLLEAGTIYVADDERHIGVGGKGGRLSIIRSDGPPINRHRPSVDFLFKSAAVLSNVRVSAVLLTGMGADGAEGMKELHDRGAITFCQDEQSCVVFGMPREAISLGAADIVARPEEIRQHLEWQISQSTGKSRRRSSPTGRQSRDGERVL